MTFELTRTRNLALPFLISLLLVACGGGGNDEGDSGEQSGIVRDLGSLPGLDAGCEARSLNNTGTVIGSCGNGDSTERYFRWTETDGMTVLDDRLVRGIRDFVSGLNDAGQVVGGIESDGDEPVLRAFRLSRGDFDLIAPGPSSYATAINGSGEIVGTYAEDNRFFGFLFDDFGFNRLPGDFIGFAISDGGVLAGYTESPTTRSRPALLRAGAVTDLGTFGGPGGVAYDINEAGQVVGTADLAETTTCLRSICNKNHPFLFDGSGSLVDLDAFGADAGTARAINESGAIVGNVVVASEDVPFVYDATRGMRRLEDLLPESSGYTVTHVSDINDRGQIAGTAIREGRARAVLIDGAGFFGN